MRREVIRPTRDGPEFSTAVTLSITSLPRRTRPSRFTRSYSDARVKRRAFEKENEAGCAMSSILQLAAIDRMSCRWRRKERPRKCGSSNDERLGRSLFRASSLRFLLSFDVRTLLFDAHPYSKSLLPKLSGEDFAKRKADEFTELATFPQQEIRSFHHS